MSVKRLIVGASGASGIPLLIQCVKMLQKEDEIHTVLIMSHAAELTAQQESDISIDAIKALADEVLDPDDTGAGPASGSYASMGMLIVPCSMKTIAGIHSGYADNLLLRAADVTLKEQRPLVLCARETPLNSIHLRNLYELSMVQGVRIVPPMISYYNNPKTIDEITAQTAARLLEAFGIEAKGYRRWKGM